MRRRPRWSHVVLSLGVIAAIAIVTPAFGISSSIKKAIKKEVAKQIANASGPAGPPGPQGTNGTNGTNGLTGADGTARAYGQVDGTGSLVSARSKNVTGITHGASAGEFCIALAAGIDVSKTAVVVTPDFSGDDTNFTANGDQTIVEWQASAPDCTAGKLEVLTGRRVVSTTGSADSDIRTVTNEQKDEGFFFVVP